MKTVSIPRIVIGGTNSGVGKTTVTLGLIAALKRKGLRIQPFKVGPDYLDTTHHTVAAGVRCRNLDGWMTDRDYVESVFTRTASDADVAVVEGVMGMFDGLSPTAEEGSTAQMAKWLNAPAVLVVDAKGLARSGAAMVKGFWSFDPAMNLAGVIFNNLGSASHLAILKEAVEAATGALVLGGLLRDSKIELPHRHLGLVTADQNVLSGELLASLGDLVDEWLDVDGILSLARSAPPMAQDQKKGSVRVGSCRIAVAMDDAFHFYYQDNLEMLEAAGAEIVAFSPLSDKALPPNTAGVYLGGGYPEVYAAQLEANDKMRSSIKRFARSGGPVYAECGGLMYLSSSIRTREGERHRMAGILPLRTAMFDKLSALRYVEVTALENSILTGPGTVFRGHEFHYSKLEEVPGDGSKVRLIYDVRGRKTEHRMREGFSMGNVLASYIHLHFGSNPELAENLVKSCLSWSSGN